MKKELSRGPCPFLCNPLRNLTLGILITVTGIVGIGLGASPAYALYCSNCSNCSTFYQQMFQYVEEVNTSLTTAEQLKTQIQQYQDMVIQGTGLPSSMFTSIAADLRSVASTYNKSQSLGRQIQNFDSQFNNQFPGFQSYLNGAANSANLTPQELYKNWSEQGRDNVRTGLEAADLNTSTFESEDNKLDTMVARSQSAAGRMQAIQAGNEKIASQNVQQLQKLRDLLATQINMQGNYMAQQGDRKAMNEATEQKFKEKPTVRGGSKGY